MNSFRLLEAAVIGGLFLALVAVPVNAQIITVSGPSIGADGAPGGGTLGGDNIFHGNDGVSGYIAPDYGPAGASFVFSGATLVGGMGGTVVGTDPTATYQAGYGGNGLLSQGGSSVTPLVTINSGSYTGGIGGSPTGIGTQLIGGGGGSGLDVNNSTAIVNGGTFVGGNGGTTPDPNSFSYSAGPGLNANFDGIIVINDGDFLGGAANQPGSGDGAGILGLGGTVNIFGGTFTGGGTTGLGIFTFGGAITLYGSNFAVNGIPTTGNLTGTGTITGTLEDDSTPTTITFDNAGDASSLLTLVNVPEPSAAAMMLLGLVGLGLVRRPRSA